jgi:hypothetical protein
MRRLVSRFELALALLLVVAPLAVRVQDAQTFKPAA